MEALYHLIDGNSLRKLNQDSCYEADSLNSDGFIHLAYERQLPFIIRSFFIAPDEKPRHSCRGCKSLMRSINIT